YKFTFSSDVKITERFVTTIKPKKEGTAVIIDDVRLSTPSNVTLDIIEQIYVDQLPNENGSYDKICYLIDYTLNGDTIDFYATIDFLK
ncbi:MAG: hypothetical protein IJC80_02110, partial [Clostridia bacterium]|nr:hypothetical protein [Clostridia bacterium]